MIQADLQCTPLIGMEVHVQLATRSKMFCRCAVVFGAPPNSLVCPVCLGLPGALPVINRRAVVLAVRMGLALSCRIAAFTKWDRKSYFYPDLPKNYQISQYDLPLAEDGSFEFEVGDESRRVGIIRAHLEEDAGRSLHDLPELTQVDLNRAGTPLLEIVTRPELHSADEAHAFCVQLQHLVTCLDIGEGSMQKGQLRFEPNVNVLLGGEGRQIATPICEIKNLNSFRAVKAAVAYEIQRHLETYGRDPTYTRQQRGRENRGWDEARGQTVFQRGKEEAHDYRYFPDPDLVPVELDAAEIDRLRAELPELPLSRSRRLVREAGLSPREAWQIVEDRSTADLFDAAVQSGAGPATLARQFISFWSKLANARGCSLAQLGIEARRLAVLAQMTAQGRISASAAAQLAEAMLDSPASPADLARSRGLEQVQDSAAIEVLVDQAIAANAKAVDEIRSRGKKWEKSLSFMQGQVMRLSGGAASPQVIREILEQKFEIRTQENDA